MGLFDAYFFPFLNSWGLNRAFIFDKEVPWIVDTSKLCPKAINDFSTIFIFVPVCIDSDVDCDPS